MLVGLLLVVLAAAAYIRVGWWRMESHCTAEPPGKPSFHSVELSFTDRGFTCVYDNGAWTESSLWFTST